MLRFVSWAMGPSFKPDRNFASIAVAEGDGVFSSGVPTGEVLISWPTSFSTGKIHRNDKKQLRSVSKTSCRLKRRSPAPCPALTWAKWTVAGVLTRTRRVDRISWRAEAPTSSNQHWAAWCRTLPAAFTLFHISKCVLMAFCDDFCVKCF